MISRLLSNSICHINFFLPAIQRLVHETPLETSRETGTTTTSKTRFLHFLEDPFMTLEENLFGLVPITTLQGTLQLEIVLHVNVGKDTIVIMQTTIGGLSVDRIGVWVGSGFSSKCTSYRWNGSYLTS